MNSVIKKLSKSDKAVLLKAIEKRFYDRNRAFGDTLENKRAFNSCKKLVKLGLIINEKIEYQHCPSVSINPKTSFGRTCRQAAHHFTFAGDLSELGIEVAHQLENA